MAKKVLALSLRPSSFSEMVGQQKITEAITQQIASGRIPNAWLFSGETGAGKTTIARILARSLQCPHYSEVGSYCTKCGASTGVIEVNASELNGVDAIKDLALGSNYAPPPPAIKRVYILDEAQRVTKQAQSVLLKYFEEAPATTVWIICTTEPEQILRALRSRCMSYQMQPLRNKAASEFVKRAAASAKITRDTAPFLDMVHERNLTSPRAMLNALEKYAAGLDPDKAIQSIDSEIDTLRICQAMCRGEWGPVRSELEKATTDDARTIRGAVLGYLRAILLNRKPSADLKVVCECIKDMGALGYQDEGALLALVSASLYRCCKRF